MYLHKIYTNITIQSFLIHRYKIVEGCNMVQNPFVLLALLMCSIGMLNAKSLPPQKLSNEENIVKQKIVIERWDRKKEWVYDRKHHLMWQDNNAVAHSEYTWQDAKAYCNHFSLGGYNDWRLPRYEELLYLVDYSRNDPAIVEIFTNVGTSSNYWTKTKHIEQESRAWIVYFYNGYTYSDEMKTKNYARCVRTF